MGEEFGKDSVQPAGGRVIFRNNSYVLRYHGPDTARPDRVVITFPDLIHSTGEAAEPWAGRFLRKRGAAVLALTFEEANWYQSDDFFPALDAACSFLGPNLAITTYGGSMGGYAALLAGRRLKADRVVALCPQFSIDQSVAPFERRFRAEAQKIGPFKHDVKAELSDNIQYFVMYDPTHRIDQAHIALFAKPNGWQEIVLPGAGHGVLPTLVEMGATQALYDLISGGGDARALRQAARQGRCQSNRYLRRMGNLCSKNPRRKSALTTLVRIVRERGLNKLANRWSEALQCPAPAIAPKNSSPDELIVHVGMPKTGTSSLQKYFEQFADAYRKQGVEYPIGAKRSLPHHGWFGKSLLSGNFTELDAVFCQSTTPRMILSDETIYNEALFAEERTVSALQKRLSNTKLSLIVCLREPESWKLSFYKQALENRRRPSAQGSAAFWGLSDPYEAFYQRAEVARLADQEHMIKQLEWVFGQTVDTIELQPGQNAVGAFLAKVGLNQMGVARHLGGNPSISDLDAELLRQANAQSAQAHGFMRLLIAHPAGSSDHGLAQRLRPGKRELVQTTAPKFNWSAIRFKPNPPLKFSQQAFETRKNALRERAEALRAALVTGTDSTKDADFIDRSVSMQIGGITGPLEQSEAALVRALNGSSGTAVAWRPESQTIVTLDKAGDLIDVAEKKVARSPKTHAALKQILAQQPSFGFVVDMQDRRLRSVADEGQRPYPVFCFNRVKTDSDRLLWPLPIYHDLDGDHFLADVHPDAVAWEEKTLSVVWRGITGGRAAGAGAGSGEGMRLSAAIRAFRAGRMDETRLREVITTLPRYQVVARMADDPRFDLGFVDGDGYSIADTPLHAQFERPRMTRQEMQRSKYIAVLRGLDVGSSFYWVMNSGSVGFVMDTPFESFASSHFKAWEHFIPFQEDGSDLAEKLDWAEANEAKCRKMARRAAELCQLLGCGELRDNTLNRVIVELNNLEQS